MGRYSLIIVGTLILLLTYFVISMANVSAATTRRNIDAFEYNNAKNIAISAAQLIIGNIVSETWNDAAIHNNPVPNYVHWNELYGDYRITSVDTDFMGNLVVTVAGRSNDREYDTVIHFARIFSIETRFDYAAYSKHNLSINTQGYINSFNSASGTNDPTNNAPVGYGPDGTFTNSGTIEGTVSHKVEKDLPIAAPPPGVYTPLIITNDSNTLNTPGQYEVPTITLTGNNHLQFAGGDYILHITSHIHIGGNSLITVHSDASLKLYVDGNVHIAGNGIVNNTNLAQNFIIYGGAGTATVDLQGSTNSNFTGAIYAPNADIRIFGGNDFTVRGAVIGDAVEIRATLLFDEALATLEEEVNETASRYSVLSWH